MSRVVDLDTLAASEKYTDTVIFNGVNGDTGSYLFEDSDAQTVAEIARQEDRNVVTDNTLNRRHEIDTDEHLGLISGDRDADKVAEAGWALIAGRDVDPAVLEALSPLRDHRRRQAGQLYREYCDPESALRTGESRLDFLLRHGVSPFDAADPGEMPYYVLLIGGPDQIPFEFQYGLSVQRAVGRIDFDFAQDYAQYAENVVAAEQSAGNKDARRLDVFAPQNDYDIATALSSRRLAEPLINELRKGSDPPDITEAIGEQATKRRLDTVMRGSAIDVLLTATHGFGVTGERQRDLQGALVVLHG
ncbi:hypothetical protein [Mycolicibacterium peregrinum]|uniref:hypothetical protein n=1 Tax=Mycolicibacterium peregrinum TaxID=43304 RepID=UPI003AAD5DD2